VYSPLILKMIKILGSSVSESATGSKEVVIQGDVMFELPALLMSEFKVLDFPNETLLLSQHDYLGRESVLLKITTLIPPSLTPTILCVRSLPQQYSLWTRAEDLCVLSLDRLRFNSRIIYPCRLVLISITVAILWQQSMSYRAQNRNQNQKTFLCDVFNLHPE
jgi:hypothetical protein